jgi:hypothetical protein
MAISSYTKIEILVMQYLDDTMSIKAAKQYRPCLSCAVPRQEVCSMEWKILE